MFFILPSSSCTVASAGKQEEEEVAHVHVAWPRQPKFAHPLKQLVVEGPQSDQKAETGLDAELHMP